MIFVGIVFFYGIIAIHDIPYEIAKKRDHPHLEAIHYAGWVSMFTLHSIWPFLWIWATIYHAERGYGFSETGSAGHNVIAKLDAMEHSALCPRRLVVHLRPWTQRAEALRLDFYRSARFPGSRGRHGRGVRTLLRRPLAISAARSSRPCRARRGRVVFSESALRLEKEVAS